MICKKMNLVCFALGVGAGYYIVKMPGSLDYKLHYLKRKLNCLKRKMERAIKSMTGDNIEKYSKELTSEFERIKDKVDNLTIRDIKDKSSEVFQNILTSINDFKEKLMNY